MKVERTCIATIDNKDITIEPFDRANIRLTLDYIEYETCGGMSVKLTREEITLLIDALALWKDQIR